MDITLRLPINKDAETMLSWENNPENLAVANLVDRPYVLIDIIELIESFKNTRRPDQVRFMIHAGDLLLGAVDIFDINYDSRSGAIGVLIADEQNRRRGFASRALTLVEIEARKIGLDRLIALIHANNTSSRKLFEKLGYTFRADVLNSDKTKSIIVEKWVKEEY